MPVLINRKAATFSSLKEFAQWQGMAMHMEISISEVGRDAGANDSRIALPNVSSILN
jgi:hypothetical protein